MSDEDASREVVLINATKPTEGEIFFQMPGGAVPLRLKPYGDIQIARNGKEALISFNLGRTKKEPLELICLDIMMPGIDGQTVLKEIRKTEENAGVLPGQGAKIIMTTALDDTSNVKRAFYELCDGYLVKPIQRKRLLGLLHELGLIEEIEPAPEAP